MGRTPARARTHRQPSPGDPHRCSPQAGHQGQTQSQGSHAMIEGLKRRYFVLTASGCFSQLMLFGVGSMYQIPYFFRADKAEQTRRIALVPNCRRTNCSFTLHIPPIVPTCNLDESSKISRSLKGMGERQLTFQRQGIQDQNRSALVP